MSTPVPGEGTFDTDRLVAAVDDLLSTDAEGTDEAELLENAHRMVADALDGKVGQDVRDH